MNGAEGIRPKCFKNKITVDTCASASDSLIFTLKPREPLRRQKKIRYKQVTSQKENLNNRSENEEAFSVEQRSEIESV